MDLGGEPARDSINAVLSPRYASPITEYLLSEPAISIFLAGRLVVPLPLILALPNCFDSTRAKDGTEARFGNRRYASISSGVLSVLSWYSMKNAKPIASASPKAIACKIAVNG